jgi:hypothetical protein
MTGSKAANPFLGRWRITESELWEPEDLDLVVPAFIEFEPANSGEFAFIAVQGRLDWRLGERGGAMAVEFSWEGQDEGDDVMGRGWAVLRDEALEVRWFFHQGDETWFRAKRQSRPARKSPSSRRPRARYPRRA